MNEKYIDHFFLLLLWTFLKCTCLKWVSNLLTLFHYCGGFLLLLQKDFFHSLLSFYCHLLNQNNTFTLALLATSLAHCPCLVRALLCFVFFRGIWIESHRVSPSYHWYNVRDPAVRPHEVSQAKQPVFPVVFISLPAWSCLNVLDGFWPGKFPSLFFCQLRRDYTID